MKLFAFFSLLLWSVSVPHLFAQIQDTPMTTEDMVCLQKIIYFNECSERAERMATWNYDEDFPSFGIGHFIWYPTNKRGPFKDAFPEFLSFLEAQKVTLPDWIKALPTREAPWQDREEFQKDLSSERMKVLRDLLEQTQGLQAQFILHRFDGVLPKMLDAIPEAERPAIEQKFKAIANAPHGMFALIDYVNFKGIGVLETERSQGQGWGLLQVLQEMKDPEKKEILEEFVRAAKKTLENRVRNAPSDKDYSKRLGGWKIRIKNYLKIRC